MTEQIGINLTEVDTEIKMKLDELFGTGIANIEQTVASDIPGGTNVWTATLTNGRKSNLYVMNGTTSGSPIIAASSSEMTNHSAIYLYVGDQPQFTKGHMYYYNGSSWSDAGMYDNNPVLELVDYPTAPLPPGELNVALQPNKFYNIPATVWTAINVSLNNSFASNGVMNQCYLRFITGTTPPTLSFTGITAPEAEVKENKTYDIFIYHNKDRSQAIAHIWEDGVAIGSGGGGVSITVEGERAVFG